MRVLWLMIACVVVVWNVGCSPNTKAKEQTCTSSKTACFQISQACFGKELLILCKCGLQNAQCNTRSQPLVLCQSCSHFLIARRRLSGWQRASLTQSSGSEALLLLLFCIRSFGGGSAIIVARVLEVRWKKTFPARFNGRARLQAFSSWRTYVTA